MTLEVRGPLARRAVKQAAATEPTPGPGQVAEAIQLLTAHTRSGPVVAAEKALRAAALRADALVREQAEAALNRIFSPEGPSPQGRPETIDYSKHDHRR